ncbi:hypothetical protein HPB51_007374 [Rhipicephalus microplus]|uniref:Uncharacterized protein n=1 Tax=Rhipicephalus microplus TaxID=6941 RepID=A0A9J6EZS0_RHIMP|nr:hypothetical protein HPB51_007374 [Rhipicephalus microplus]
MKRHCSAPFEKRRGDARGERSRSDAGKTTQGSLGRTHNYARGSKGRVPVLEPLTSSGHGLSAWPSTSCRSADSTSDHSDFLTMTNNGKKKEPNRNYFTQPHKPATTNPVATSKHRSPAKAPALSTARNSWALPHLSESSCVLTETDIAPMNRVMAELSAYIRAVTCAQSEQDAVQDIHQEKQQQQLEQQVVTAIGGWLGKTKETTPPTMEPYPTVPQHAAVVTTSPISMGATAPSNLPTDDPTSTLLPASTNEVPMDVVMEEGKTQERPCLIPMHCGKCGEVTSNLWGKQTVQGPRNTSAVVPRPSPPPAGEYYQTVVSKPARRRARALKDTAIATDPAVAGTALYRPSTSGGLFPVSPRLKLAAALTKRPDVTAVRVNHRRNIVAADAAMPVCLSELLTINDLNGIPVVAREPADRRSSVGFLHDVDGDLTYLELSA